MLKKICTFNCVSDFKIIVNVDLGLLLSDADKKKYTLLEIEKLLRRNGTSLSRFEKMPKVPNTSSCDSNVLILDERSYDQGVMGHLYVFFVYVVSWVRSIEFSERGITHNMG